MTDNGAAKTYAEKGLAEGLTRVPAPSDEELKKIVKYTDLKYNVNPKEYVSKKVTTGDSKNLGVESTMVATTDIAKGEILYRGHEMLSYKPDPKNDTTFNLDVAIEALTDEQIKELAIAMSHLYPYEESDMCRELASNYGLPKPAEEGSALMIPKYWIIMWTKLNQYVSGVLDHELRRHVYMNGSKFNHSCDPNCAWDVKNDILTVKAMVDIKKGDECTVMYDFYWKIGGLERKAKIKNMFGFHCKCTQCTSDKTDDGSAHMSACLNRLQFKMYEGCVMCGSLAAKLLKCSRCKAVEYCSKACQESDWKLAHKDICKKA